MEIHGGFIMADSVPGEGSTFTCYFPTDIRGVTERSEGHE
jgi:signal transduction histidine kinase